MRRSFHQKEDSAILAGIRTYGEGCWAKIKAAYPELKDRSGVQIKDRFRNMMKKDPALLIKLEASSDLGGSGNLVTPGNSAKKKQAKKSKKIPKLTSVEFEPGVVAGVVSSPSTKEEAFSAYALASLKKQQVLKCVQQAQESEKDEEIPGSFQLHVKLLSGVLFEVGLVEKKCPPLFDICCSIRETIQNLMAIITTYDSDEVMEGEEILEILSDARIEFESSKEFCKGVEACVESYCREGVGPNDEGYLPLIRDFSNIVKSVYDGASIDVCQERCKGYKLSTAVSNDKRQVIRPGKPNIVLNYYEKEKPDEEQIVVAEEVKEGEELKEAATLKIATIATAVTTSSSSTKNKTIAVDLVSSPQKKPPAKRKVSFAQEAKSEGAEHSSAAKKSKKQKKKKKKKGKKNERKGQSKSPSSEESSPAPAPPSAPTHEHATVITILTQHLGSGAITPLEYSMAVNALSIHR